MSRGCTAEDVGLRQHRGRLLQLAETSAVGSNNSSNTSGGSSASKRRAYSTHHSLFKSLQQMTAAAAQHNTSTTLPTKLLSFEQVVRNDPSYTPNIEHLVFPFKSHKSQTNSSNVGSSSSVSNRDKTSCGTGTTNSKSARSKLAEMFAISKLKHHQRPLMNSSSVSEDRTTIGGGVSNASSAGSSSTITSRKTSTKVGSVDRSGDKEPVTSVDEERGGDIRDSSRGTASGGVTSGGPTIPGTSTFNSPSSVTVQGTSSSGQHQHHHRQLHTYHHRGGVTGGGGSGSIDSSSSSKTNNPSVDHHHHRRTEDVDVQEMPAGGGTTTRGPNVSVLHLRSTSEPWESNIPTSGYRGGSLRVSRELSPVRWCDREVDGVYLGRSGWVQVQQRSLDENRRTINYIPPSNSPAISRAPSPRIKMADYHCSKSEPGVLRPGYLPLPKEIISPASLDLSHEEPITPPPATPIISPPPAFQDADRRFNSVPRPRTATGKPPFLARSNAVEEPTSPPTAVSRTSSLQRSELKTSPLSGPIGKSRWPNRSPISTPQQHCKSLEDPRESTSRRNQFQKYDSSSSSSSSFGFRSLDGNLPMRGVGGGVAMPRLSETDSSLGGYGDEEDNMSPSLNPSSYSTMAMLTSSPDATRQPRQHHRQARRSPGSDGSGKKLGSPSSSSSSSSESRSPFRRSISHNTNNNNNNNRNSHNSRVRRSRSLQLPERKSPVSPQQQQQLHHHNLSSGNSSIISRQQPQQQQQPSRMVVKINGSDQQHPRRHLRMTQSEEAQLRREAEEEARIVTDFVWGVRSRDAARALLYHHGHSGAPSNQEQPPVPSFNVVFVDRNQSNRNPRRVGLQRGATTPVSKGSSPVGFCPNPCNPTTCDFWPHCAHRDGIYTTTKTNAPTPTNASPVPPASLRLSHSYPNTVLRERKPEQENNNSRTGYHSTRSSPASLERVDVSNVSGTQGKRTTNVSPIEVNSVVLNSGLASLSSSSSSSEIWITTSDRTLTRSPRGTPQEYNEEEEQEARPDSAPAQHHATRRDLEQQIKQQQQQQRSLSLPKSFQAKDTLIHRSQTGWGGSGGGSRTLAASAGGGSAGRPSSNNPSISLHQKQQLQQLAGSLLRPSTPETARTAPATPVHDISSNTLVVDNIRLQPGSSNAGTGVSSNLTTSTKTRFSSTPHLDPAANIRRQQWVVDSRSTIHNNKNNNNDDNDEHYEDEEDYDDDDDDDGGHGGDCDNEDDDHDIEVGHTNQASSSNTTSKSKDNCKQRLQKSYTSNSSVQGGIGSASTSSESVLQKFRKSFSLRFYKKGGGGGVSSSKDDEEHQQPQRASTEPSLPITSSSTCSCPSKDDNSSDKFRFGPLIWRSSKERKKGKKAARSAKCNSGDSGIQIEISTSRGGGDSSESQHDTDHMCEEEQMCDDVDSPLVVRRRPNNTANCDSSIGDSKPPSRPSSDVINQILIDKLKAGLQAHSFSRHVGRGSHVPVRRTHSDLGGQRLFNWEMRGSYRRMLSTPSPIKIRPNLSPRKSNNTSTTDITSVTNIKASSRRLACRLTGLRRSISQPLGLNELSSIKTIGNIGGRVSHVSHLSEDEKGITSDDEILSDSESSMTSLNERKKSFEQVMDEEVVILAEAVWDHVAMETEELAFRAGDVIEVLDTLDRDWWWGSCNNCVGWFPSAFVRLRVSQEDTVEDCLAAMASGGSKQLRRRTSISLLSNDQVRSRVVRELINTERDFVKVLRDVAEGYLAECRRRTDMFSEEQITTIFGNLEQLLQFQSEFLEDLEKCVEWDAPHKSCIGDTFLKHQAGFRMYSEYCNSHPLAIATLQELYQHNSYNKFFEACRLMRGLIEIPLDGYLLTPVQRICKYPLQLAELLKYTKSDHLDHSKIQEALEAMRGVAVLINERKRRMESLEKLASWQQRVEGWEGDDLIEGSSQLIYQGEAVRITTGMWTSSIMLFLFDHQLVYCKKDILKRNTYVYKGRMEMDTSDVINVADGKDPQLGVSIRHGIKVYSCIRDKWLLFCCRTQQEKSKWLEAFAEERRLVAQDLRDGLEFAPAARQLARIAAAQCYRRPPNKPRGKNYKRGIGSSDAVALSARSNGLNGSTHSLGRRVGTWFTFGGNKKTRALGRAATLQTVHPS